LSGVVVGAGPDEDETPADEDGLDPVVEAPLRLLDAMVDAVAGMVLFTPVEVATETVETIVDEPEVVVEINAPMANVPVEVITSLTFETSVAINW